MEGFYAAVDSLSRAYNIFMLMADTALTNAAMFPALTRVINLQFLSVGCSAGASAKYNFIVYI
jgi:hypothetical protein